MSSELDSGGTFLSEFMVSRSFRAAITRWTEAQQQAPVAHSREARGPQSWRRQVWCILRLLSTSESCLLTASSHGRRPGLSGLYDKDTFPIHGGSACDVITPNAITLGVMFQHGSLGMPTSSVAEAGPHPAPHWEASVKWAMRLPIRVLAVQQVPRWL